jgi:hypothetical protein
MRHDIDGTARMSGIEPEASGTETKADDVNTVACKAFSSLTGPEKARYVGKVVVFFVTFGFVFPNILID